jgi:hypothetical protein
LFPDIELYATMTLCKGGVPALSAATEFCGDPMISGEKNRNDKIESPVFICEIMFIFSPSKG